MTPLCPRPNPQPPAEPPQPPAPPPPPGDPDPEPGWHVNLVVMDMDEETEVDPGGFMPLNSDFDEKNKDSSGNFVPDTHPNHTTTITGGHRIVANDRELRHATLYVSGPTEVEEGAWTITFPDKIKLWIWRAHPICKWVSIDSGHRETTALPARQQFIVEGIAPSQALRDVTITASLNGEGSITESGAGDSGGAALPGGSGASDTVKLTLVNVDADVDSDNNNGTDDPARTHKEEHLEDKANEPGKILSVNDGDVDGDGIPDFADGYRLVGGGPNAASLEGVTFIPYILDLRGVPNSELVRIRFIYSASHPWHDSPTTPGGVVRTGSGTPHDPYVWTPGPGYLRLWTRNANERTTEGPLRNNGQYVAPNIDYVLGDFGEDRPVESRPVEIEPGVYRLWIEAVRPILEPVDQLIKVEVDPDAWEPGGHFETVATDSVRVTSVKVDFVKTWSDQFPGVAVNYAPGGTGYQGPDPANNSYVFRKPYILVGTRQDDRLYVKTEISITPDLPSIRSKLLVRMMSELEEVLDATNAAFPGLNAGATIQGNVVSLHSDSEPAMTVANGTMRNDVFIVWGLDNDGNGGLASGEVLGRAAHYVRAVNDDVYNLAWRELRWNVWGGWWYDYEHAANFLWAFMNNLGLHGAVNYPNGAQLTPNEYKLTHNVGALFPANGSASISKAVFTTTSGSSLVPDISTSYGMKELYDATLLANANTIRAWFEANPTATTHTFDAGFGSVLQEVKFLASNGDEDLNYAIGDAVTSGVRIMPTVTKLVLASGAIEYWTTTIALSGTLTDLYDFDFDAPGPADAGAVVQTGYNAANWIGGNVFKIEVQFGNTVNYLFRIPGA